MTDPEDVTQLRQADLAEVGVDETPDEERARPLEADLADVSEQRTEIADADEQEPVEPDVDF